MDNSYGLAAIQANLLKELLVFDQLCRDHHIQYSLHGGTLLGAERNHQFIPWDDDVDVSMKRSEYKRFYQLADSLPDGFKLDDTSFWVPRLIMQTEDSIVTIDILIWDYISSNKIIQKVKITLLRFYQGMLKDTIEYDRFSMLNKIFLFITHLFGKLIPFSVKLKQFNYLCEHTFIGDKGCIHRANDAFLGVSYVFDSAYMDGYDDIEFEQYLFMVNVRYHEFLERNYGPDYLTPPPVNLRRPEHDQIRKVKMK